ncbi:hypothetical protein D1012_02775 [Pseudotabrizicola alkalilacus]|uniref:Uncharacterized protein n=1 Tax=Pseudotabrizicola alkalilacus TaxID=2305252 RepID=A0A411Z7S6_9RHOB|nr:hypothetical protein D1012_02775 [Pseudotabrizicola alkalilacus]
MQSDRTDYLPDVSTTPPIPQPELSAILGRIQAADDPWTELMLWLRERAAFNQSLGGDDETLVNLIVVWVTQLSLPVMQGGRNQAPAGAGNARGCCHRNTLQESANAQD